MRDVFFYVIKNLIVPITVGVGSSLISLLWNHRKEINELKRTRLKEKYDNFYLPFIELYNNNIFGATDYTDLPQKLQKEFSTLILKCEMRYSDQKLSDCIYAYKACLYEINNDPFGIEFPVERMVHDLNEAFNELHSYIYELYFSAKSELGY